MAAEKVPSVLHVADAEVVIELVIEIERLLHMGRLAIGQLDARLLAPEQVGDETHEPRFGELVGVVAHGVVDAPDLHDGDDGAGRRAVGEGKIGAHLAVAKLHGDVLRFHGVSRVGLGRTASRLVSTMTNCGPGRERIAGSAASSSRERMCVTSKP
jgi:hypothetical protein